MLYHPIRDIFYVMQFLDHKHINNTMIYIQHEKTLFKNGNEDFVCKVASTPNEMKELIEAGFEYVCEFNGGKVFRKRK